MNADSFEELVTNCALSGFQHRMLYVFVKAGVIGEGEGTGIPGDTSDDADSGFVQVLFDAHQPVAHGLNFDQVRDVADQQTPDWNMVVVGIAKNSDASLPSDEQAKAFLSNMREKVMTGDVSDFAIFDRDGAQVSVETQIVAQEDSSVIH